MTATATLPAETSPPRRPSPVRRVVAALRNTWRLAPGQIFDKTYLDSMLAKLEKPTVVVFGEMPVHYQKMGNWLRSNPQNHVIDVLIDFQ